MHAHRIDSFLIGDNVRLEIVHESNPYFSGENISIVFRLRHLGSMQEYLHYKSKVNSIHKDIVAKLNSSDTSDSIDPRATHNDEATSSNIKSSDNRKKQWSMRSFFNGFTDSETKSSDQNLGNNDATADENDSRAMYSDQKVSMFIKKQLEYHRTVSLISGSVQISGIFQYDVDVIDDDKFKKKGNKIVGIDKITEQSNTSYAKYFNSNFANATSGLAAMSSNNNVVISGNEVSAGIETVYEQESIDYHELPILVIPQTLLFSEITLEPGEVKTYHYKSPKIPLDLCPSYSSSKNIAINYSLEFGVNQISHDKVIPYNINLPIFIAPNIDDSGLQQTAELDKETYITIPATIKELKQYHPHRNTRTLSTASAISMGRRASTYSQDESKSSKKFIKNFVELVSSMENDKSLHIEDLIESQLSFQFNRPDNYSDSGNTDFETKDSIENSIINTKMHSVKRNIEYLKNNSHMILNDTEKKNLAPQLHDIQKNYTINRNGSLIATLALSKLIYTASDDINIVLNFDDSNPDSEMKITAVTAGLEIVELLNPEYVTDKNVPTSTTQRISETQAVCFEHCESMPLKLTIPKTPMNQIASQFKTNIFQVKWLLALSFVLINKKETPNIFKFYEDKKGALFHSSENMEGETFTCRIPVYILPTADDFGGW